MQRRILLPLAAFLVLALCCSAVGAEVPESIEVSVGGVHYRLLVPKGYRHVSETAPEYAHFAKIAQSIPPPQQALAVFADEQTLRFLSSGAAEPKFKYVLASAHLGNAEVTKTDFAASKKGLVDAAGRENLRREIRRTENKLGLQPGSIPDPAMRDAPAEYLIMSAYMPPDEQGDAMGMVVMITAVDKRLLGFGFSESGVTPDALDGLAEEAEAYARRYIDAGRVTFAQKGFFSISEKDLGDMIKLAIKVVVFAIVIIVCRAWRRKNASSDEAASRRFRP